MFRLLLLFPILLSAGCKSCVNPGVPGPQGKDTQPGDSGDTEDTEETAHTGDSSPPIDTTPEPPCDVPEVEPHSVSDPQELPLDQWACGSFSSMADWEYFQFRVDQPDWVRLAIRASSIGSSADVAIVLADDDDGSYYANVASSAESSDPFLVFPSDEARDFVVAMGESYYGYGDDYTWEMMATVTKPPVEWTTEEVEPNDDIGAEAPIAEGEVIFATISSTSDFDRFSFEIPDDAKRDVRVTVVAIAEGSPADTRLLAYDPEGKLAKSAASGESLYDRDPVLEFSTDAAGTWTLLVREDYDKGSPFYWYTIQLEISDPPADTADTGGTGEGG